MDFSLHKVFQIIKRRLWVVLFVIILVCGLTAAYTKYEDKPVYEASSRLIVNNKGEVDMQPLEYSEISANIQLIETYKEIIKSSKILDVVVKKHPELNLDVKQLLESVNVSSIFDTQVMVISAKDKDYDKASKIANAVSHEFQTQIPSIMKVDNVSILDEAESTIDIRKISTDPVLTLLLSFVLSLLLAAGFVFLLEYLDDTFRSEEDIQNVLNIPHLGTITKVKKQNVRPKRSQIAKGRQVDSTYAGVN
ncbi:YveK family protein [Paenibacillus montanisoli]|uniref:Lipopolysaccharide biosynthesis protein n=1 Tax=Paenibacillus montanisoli TaxID=2081970 RepID=A0A328U5Y0_9BACL|nr:Wzz/FepE/Etk N-terminal domain-containing protein [Paenibacillus montanisoli]RAP77482.1 lipopolysaccharide biosynthesis protein [Paenibacillus montanisoli]